MKLLVGLGNPGEKYAHNRHNVGFMFLDWLLAKIGLPESSWKPERKRGADRIKETLSLCSRVTISDQEILLAKPQTFMNDSGRGVKKLISNFQFSISNDLVVIHDDLDIKLGEFKIQKGKGPKAHNGVDSVEESLQTKDLWRVRIGVDNRNAENRIPGETYTLQNFTEEEKVVLEKVFSQINLSVILEGMK